MQNKIVDLNNHLFEVLERLKDDEICDSKESLEKEIRRADAVINIADEIIKVNALQLEAYKVIIVEAPHS